MSKKHFTRSQIIVHWLSAIILLVIITLPLAKTALSPMIGGIGNLFFTHKSFAVLLLILTIWRLFLLAKDGRPQLLGENAKLQKFASHLVQIFIYLSIFAMFFSGYIMSPYPIPFFGLFSIPNLEFSDSIRGTAHTIHVTVPYFLIGCVTLHILAAFYHHFVQKDGVMESILKSE